MTMSATTFNTTAFNIMTFSIRAMITGTFGITAFSIILYDNKYSSIIDIYFCATLSTQTSNACAPK